MEAERDRLYEIGRLKAAGIQDRHLLEWTFRDAEDTPVIRMAENYVRNWSKAKAENLGLLFWGDVGTGKSFAAACIANALIEMGVPVLTITLGFSDGKTPSFRRSGNRESGQWKP